MEGRRIPGAASGHHKLAGAATSGPHATPPAAPATAAVHSAQAVDGGAPRRPEIAKFEKLRSPLSDRRTSGYSQRLSTWRKYVMGFCPRIWGLPMLHHTTCARAATAEREGSGPRRVGPSDLTPSRSRPPRLPRGARLRRHGRRREDPSERRGRGLQRSRPAARPCLCAASSSHRCSRSRPRRIRHASQPSTRRAQIAPPDRAPDRQITPCQKGSRPAPSPGPPLSAAPAARSRRAPHTPPAVKITIRESSHVDDALAGWIGLGDGGRNPRHAPSAAAARAGARARRPRAARSGDAGRARARRRRAGGAPAAASAAAQTRGGRSLAPATAAPPARPSAAATEPPPSSSTRARRPARAASKRSPARCAAGSRPC